MSETPITRRGCGDPPSGTNRRGLRWPLRRVSFFFRCGNRRLHTADQQRGRDMSVIYDKAHGQSIGSHRGRRVHHLQLVQLSRNNAQYSGSHEALRVCLPRGAPKTSGLEFIADRTLLSFSEILSCSQLHRAGASNLASMCQPTRPTSPIRSLRRGFETQRLPFTDSCPILAAWPLLNSNARSATNGIFDESLGVSRVATSSMISPHGFAISSPPKGLKKAEGG